MNQHRKVPGIAQGPKQFTPSSFVPMQSPILGQAQQPQGAAVSEQMQDLAMEIYCRLAVSYLTDSRYETDPSSACLQRLAQDAQMAALAYFQTMGEVPNG